MSKIALITGANKGIGLAIAQELGKLGFKVLLGVRDDVRGRKAVEQLKSEGLDATFLPLFVDSEDSVLNAAETVAENHGHLDVLVNNAALSLDAGRGILEVSSEVFRETFETNVWGVLRVTQAFWPLLQKSSDARVVNVSSGAGRLYDMGHEMPSYAVSKTALNALTRQFAGLGEGKISVNSVCPGWVRTDMGGPNASRTPAQGAAIAVKMATMENPPTGQYLNDAGEIGW